jgi:conjugative transfer signal peptidase TraF
MSRTEGLLASIAVAALAASAVLKPAPRLLWNASASAPIGLYRVSPGAALHVGDWVAARPPSRLAPLFAARRYLPRDVPLVKRVAATPPSTVCRIGRRIAIDGATAASARVGDSLGRPLPTWRGCRRLALGEVFLLNGVPGSLDGRYFGPIGARAVVGRLTPLWIDQGRTR